MVAGASFSPAMIVPTLLDFASTPANVRASTACACESWKTLPARWISPGTAKGVDGVTTPSSSAAAAVITLLVEPGSYTSDSARLDRLAGLLWAGTLGSNVGAFASARILPSTVITTTV